MSAVEMAIKMETDAIAFYKEAAEKTSHPFGKKMFLSFVEDEKRHLDMLKEIFQGLDIEIRMADPSKNVRSIFETMKDQMMQRITATSDDMNAIKIAMNMEKEGFEYYQKAAREANNDKEKALFERLTYEEEQHYTIFENTHNFLSDTGNWYMWDEYSIVEG